MYAPLLPRLCEELFHRPSDGQKHNGPGVSVLSAARPQRPRGDRRRRLRLLFQPGHTAEGNSGFAHPRALPAKTARPHPHARPEFQVVCRGK